MSVVNVFADVSQKLLRETARKLGYRSLQKGPVLTCNLANFQRPRPMPKFGEIKAMPKKKRKGKRRARETQSNPAESKKLLS